MENLDTETVVVTVKFQGKIRWFRSDRDLWVLDLNKWRNEYILQGYEVPEFQESYRGGIHVACKENAESFLRFMSEFEVEKDVLSRELAKRYQTANSWWDVSDLFPIMLVDFDNCKVGAFYPSGTPMERYVPDGWIGEFIDFANDYPEDIFPSTDKFWVKGDSDLLQLLNSRMQ